MKQLRPLRSIMAASLLFTVAGAIMELWLIYYAGRIVDVLAATTPEQLWEERGTELLLVASFVIIIRPLISLANEATDDLAFRPNAVTLMRWRAHRHLLRQSVGWFQDDLSGRTATRVRQVGDSATGAAYAVLHTLTFVGVYILGSLWVIAQADLRLLIPMLAWILLYAAHMQFVVPRFRDASRRYQEAESALTGALVDTYSNIDTIKVYADAHTLEADQRRHFAEARTAYVTKQRYEVVTNVGMATLETLLMVSLVGYAIFLWHAGDAPIGVIATATALSFRINGMAEWLLDAIANLFGDVGAAREALKTVGQPVDIQDAPDAGTLTLTEGRISVQNLSHHYGKGNGGLDRVSLDVAPGEKVALVGHSGAGKSTLVNLVLRFFEAESGSIWIDGQDIRDVTQQSLRKHVAVVGQDAILMHRSVYDNLTSGRKGITPQQIEMAVRRAAADSFILTLRDKQGRTGYDAHVGERGVKLSGGQRQRLALARAILKDAPILILDEATSALDSELEAVIQETMEELMEDRTVIAVAHRLSTIARMDRIIVLDSGRIAEEGTHTELLARDSSYARLWRRQSGGFIG